MPTSPEAAPTKEALAELLRQFPTWGHAAVHYKAQAEDRGRVLLQVEGALLGYYTDIPEAEIQRLLPEIREALGDFEARG